MRPREINAQVDFSGGQIDAIALRRDDTKIGRTSVRRARNNLPTPTGASETRMGRVLKAVGNVRTDDIRMSNGARTARIMPAAGSNVRLLEPKPQQLQE